jgi:TolC family type I secretion outer membrane protein
MTDTVKYAVFIFFLLAMTLLLTGCRTTNPPLTPNRLTKDNPNSYREEEIKAFAERFAEKKQAERKLLSKKQTPPESKKISKISDPAWESIRKQKLDTSKALTLTELIDLGLRNNPTTRQAWENTCRSRALQKQAESKLYPQIDVSGGATREKITANQPASDIDDSHFGGSVKLTYLLLDFGGRRADIDGTLQEVLVADAQYNQAIQDLLLNVEKAYYGFYSSQASLEAAEMDLKNAEADYNSAEEKFAVGLVSKLDVLQAKSNYDDALYKLEEAKGNVKNTRATLAQSVGLAADTKFDIVVPKKPLPSEVSEADVSQLIEESINRRPDIISLRAELEAKKSAIKVATSDLLPTLNFGSTGSGHNYKYYDREKSREHDHGYSAYLTIDWNIFDGFYNLNKKRQSEIESSIALDKLIQAEVALSAEVWTKYYDFNTAVRKLKFSETFFDSSSTSYDLALESYKSGLKDILDLLQAQSKLSEARSRLIQSKQDVFVALAELAHATGSLNNGGGKNNVQK